MRQTQEKNKMPQLDSHDALQKRSCPFDHKELFALYNKVYFFLCIANMGNKQI